MAAASQADTARSRPLTLDFLQELGALADLSFPRDAIDPHGEWTAAYRLWLVQQNFSGGALSLHRQPDGDGCQLTVTADVAEYAGFRRHTSATIACAKGELTAPRSWRLETSTYDTAEKLIPATRLEETGQVHDGRVERHVGGVTRHDSLPTPFTSNWSLFEAVQRLPGPATRPLLFTMLEDLDLVKAEQTLSFREARELKLGGRTLSLWGYQQLGRGVLPWQYWVDRDTRRLLFAFSGIRAFLCDAGAQAWMRRKLQSGRTRSQRRRKGAQ